MSSHFANRIYPGRNDGKFLEMFLITHHIASMAGSQKKTKKNAI